MSLSYKKTKTSLPTYIHYMSNDDNWDQTYRPFEIPSRIWGEPIPLLVELEEVRDLNNTYLDSIKLDSIKDRGDNDIDSNEVDKDLDFIDDFYGPAIPPVKNSIVKGRVVKITKGKLSTSDEIGW